MRTLLRSLTLPWMTTRMKMKRAMTGMVRLSGQRRKLKGALKATFPTRVPHISISLTKRSVKKSNLYLKRVC